MLNKTDKLYLYVPILIRDPGTQRMFIESMKNSFPLIFVSWTTGRKTVNTGRDYQLDIGSSSDINSPKFLTAAHQTDVRSGPSNKTNNIAIFDHFDVVKSFVETNGVSYPRDAIVYEYEKKSYLNQ